MYVSIANSRVQQAIPIAVETTSAINGLSKARMTSYTPKALRQVIIESVLMTKYVNMLSATYLEKLDTV
jgi:hypothetical protein